MDHHCPWTSNCVSHRTYPHFVRFLLYAVASMSYLEYFLYLRGAVIWENRHMPSYHGPSVVQIAHLFILFAVNTLTLFMLGILLIRTLWCVGANTTTIEGWEIERHETLVRRSRVFGGYLQTPEGQRMRIARQEFPYDIGIWQNFKQGMGTGNVRIRRPVTKSRIADSKTAASMVLASFRISNPEKRPTLRGEWVRRCDILKQTFTHMPILTQHESQIHRYPGHHPTPIESHSSENQFPAARTASSTAARS